jgi:DNA-binding MarR family transcriptional regulator
MVKLLDENTPLLLDHVGWRLWRASRQWKEAFDAGMRERGYPWFGEARSNVIGFLERDGIPQSALVKRMGLSKQAVQQLVDELVAEGVVARRPNPADKRGNIVVFTRAGLSMLGDANSVKLAIEDAYRAKLGRGAFRDLMLAMKKLNDEGDA